MALTSGTRRAASMAVGWLVGAFGCSLGLVYFGEIKDAFRLALGAPASVNVQANAAGPGHKAKRRADSFLGPTVEIKAGSHGHYYANAEINGRGVDVMVDSGASIVALTFEDAQRAGIYIRDADYTHRVNTANGQARIAPVLLDRVSIGGITVRDVPAAVSEPGKLMTSLLGMSFLSRLQRVDMRSGVLVLQE